MPWNGASCFDFIETSMETEKITWTEFPNGGKSIVEQILTSEEINQKSRNMRGTVWDPSRKVNSLSKVASDRKIITELTRSISSTRIG